MLVQSLNGARACVRVEVCETEIELAWASQGKQTAILCSNVTFVGTWSVKLIIGKLKGVEQVTGSA